MLYATAFSCHPSLAPNTPGHLCHSGSPMPSLPATLASSARTPLFIFEVACSSSPGVVGFSRTPPQTAARPGQPPWHLLRLSLLLPLSDTLSSGSPPQPRLGTAHLLCPGVCNSDDQPYTLLSSSPNLLRHLRIL